MKNNLYIKSMPFIVCGFASLFYVYDYFIQVSPAVMTHQLMSAYHVGAAGLGVLGSLFFYAYAAMQIPAGILLDKFGARQTLSLAIFVSGLGVLIFGLTHEFVWAGFSRILVGCGSAFSFIGALSLVANWFEHNRFALIAGIIQFAGCIGSIFGQAPLAHVINQHGWRQVMIIVAIITFVISLLFWIIIRDRPLNLASEQHQAEHQNNNILSVLMLPSIWWIAILGFICWIPAAGIGSLWGVPYLMKMYHWSNTQAAGLCSLFWISLGLSSPLMGWLSDHIKRRKLPFYICFGLGFVGSIILILPVKIPVSLAVISLILLGLGPAIQALTFGVAKDILPKETFCTASGFINMAPIIGGGIAQMIIGFMLSASWDHTLLNGVPVYTLQNYRLAMLFIPLCLIIGLIVTHFCLPETYCKGVKS